MKAKKPSYRKLKQLYTELEAGYKLRDDLLNTIRLENYELKKKLQERVNTTMIGERIRLASALGQWMEASAKAVSFIVGKEVL